MDYMTPEVVDLGTLVDLTAAVTITGIEDGASKNQNNHHELPPSPGPSGPIG